MELTHIPLTVCTSMASTPCANNRTFIVHEEEEEEELLHLALMTVCPLIVINAATSTEFEMGD